MCAIMSCSEYWAAAGFAYDIGDYEGGSVERATLDTNDGSQIYDVVSSAPFRLVIACTKVPLDVVL